MAKVPEKIGNFAAMKRIMLINNNDSFAYNVLELLRGIPDIEVTVVTDGQSDGADLPDLHGIDGIVLSPGAGVPDEYPIMSALLDCEDNIPMFGICLGHQAIAEHAGAILRCMDRPLHGHRSRLVMVQDDSLFEGVEIGSGIGRYHSWVVDDDGLPDTLRVLARDDDGNIQIIRHTSLPRVGVQFHPESIITDCGMRLVENWVKSL